MSCKECEAMAAQMVEIASHVAGLCNQLKPSSNAEYEYSEPFFVGGPTGTGQSAYKIKSPFVGQVQYKVDAISGASGASGYIVLVSSSLNSVIPGFVAADPTTSESGERQGLLYIGSNGISVPVTSSWYDLKDSQGILFVQVSTTLAAYAVIQFRVKR